MVARVVSLADTEGLDTLADLWVRLPRRLAGRLPVAALPAAQLGVRRRQRPPPGSSTPAAGTPRCTRRSPASSTRPGPTRCATWSTWCCSGVARGDFADTLWRAAAFARVVAAGRAHLGSADCPGASGGTSYASDLSAAKLLTMAEQLEHAARLEADGLLA